MAQQPNMIRFMNIAHRGASGYCPENTLIAFKRAFDLGVSVLECDVRMTEDGELVVIHDRTVDRTTNGQGLVCDYTLDEIQQLDAGSWFSTVWKGEFIPSLNQVLASLKSGTCLVIELKDGVYFPESIDCVIKEIRALNLEEQVHLSAFNWSVLDRVKLLAPKLPTSALVLFDQTGQEEPREIDGAMGKVYSDVGDLIEDAKKHQVSIVCPPAKAITSEMVKALHNAGFPVRAWGVRGACREELARLLSCGVDGMTTDFPDILQQVIENRT